MERSEMSKNIETPAPQTHLRVRQASDAYVAEHGIEHSGGIIEQAFEAGARWAALTEAQVYAEAGVIIAIAMGREKLKRGRAWRANEDPIAYVFGVEAIVSLVNRAMGDTPSPQPNVAGVEPVDFNKLYTHPLAQQFHEVVQAVDKLPIDSTNAVASLIDLKRAVEDEINKLLRNAKADAALLKRYHEWCGQHGCEPSTSDLYGTPSPQTRAEP